MKKKSSIHYLEIPSRDETEILRQIRAWDVDEAKLGSDEVFLAKLQRRLPVGQRPQTQGGWAVGWSWLAGIAAMIALMTTVGWRQSLPSTSSGIPVAALHWSYYIENPLAPSDPMDSSPEALDERLAEFSPDDWTQALALLEDEEG